MPVPITVKHNVQQVNADRWDVNQKSKAINWRGRARTFSGRKRERHVCVYPPREKRRDVTRRNETERDGYETKRVEKRGGIPPVFRV